METNKQTNIETYLNYEDKLKLNNLHTSYNIKKNSSYLSLIGIENKNILNIFKSYLLDIENTIYLDYPAIGILDEITDFDKTYIIDIFTLEDKSTIKDIVQYFRFNRDFIPENNIKLFILASFKTLDIFSELAYDFVTFCGFYGKFNDNNISFDYEVNEDKLNKLISEYKDFKPNTSKKIQINKMIDISKEAHYISSKVIELKYLQLALKKALKQKDDYLLGRIYNALGNYYYYSDFKISFLNYTSALKIAKKLNATDSQIKTLNNIGLISIENLDIDEAEQNFKMAKKLCEDSNNKKELGSTYINLSRIYIEKIDLDNALIMLNKALDVSINLDDKKLLTVTLSNFGSIYSSKYNYKKALTYYEKSLALSRELNDTNSILDTMYNLASIYNKIFNFIISYKYINEILTITNTLNNPHILISVYSLIAKIKLISLDFSEANDNILKSINLANQYDMEYQKYDTLFKSLEIYRYTNIDIFKQMIDSHKELNTHQIFLYEMGNYYFIKKDYKLSIKYSDKALNIFQEIKGLEYEILCLLSISNSYIALKNYNEAKLKLDLASTKAEEIQDMSLLVEVYLVYYDYYLYINDSDNSSKYYNKANYIIKNSNHKLFAKRLDDIKNKVSI